MSFTVRDGIGGHHLGSLETGVLDTVDGGDRIPIGEGSAAIPKVGSVRGVS